MTWQVMACLPLLRIWRDLRFCGWRDRFWECKWGSNGATIPG